jgi:phosphatidylglycerophosphate synthase
VAALVAEALVGEPATALLVILSVAALMLDFVDGRVARLTRTATPFGARFDGETDAFLILVLSVYVARWAGAWVLLIGAARYAFAVAGWVLPWLRGRLPPRYWRKVVAAVQGVALTYAAAEVGPHPAAYAVLVVALGLLAESFGRDVLWLRRPRRPARVVAAPSEQLRVRQP